MIHVFEELGDEAGLARALSLAGMLRYWRGEAAAAIADLEQAAGYARRVGDRAQEAESLQCVLMATLGGPTTCATLWRASRRSAGARRRNRGLEISSRRATWSRQKGSRRPHRVANRGVSSSDASANPLCVNERAWRSQTRLRGADDLLPEGGVPATASEPACGHGPGTSLCLRSERVYSIGSRTER